MTNNRPYAFVKALEFTLPWETGKPKKDQKTVSFGSILLPADGGLNYLDENLATKWGIYQKANPEVDVVNLTLEGAIEHYKKKYWDVYVHLKPISANLDNIPTSVSVACFDAGVNCGVGRAIRWLGTALESKNPHKALNELRGVYYFDLISGNREKHLKNYKGWMNRLTDLKKYCEILEQEAQNSFDVIEKMKAAKLKKTDFAA